MLTGDARRAEELAGQLDASNRERQRIENQMLAEARKMISEWPEGTTAAPRLCFKLARMA